MEMSRQLVYFDIFTLYTFGLASNGLLVSPPTWVRLGLVDTKKRAVNQAK